MKRQFAMLFALTFMVSGMAVVAEETAKTEGAEVQTAESEWTAPFEDGEWLRVDDLNAEIYLPAGWTVAEVTETGFTAVDAEGVSGVDVVLEEFDQDAAESEGVELSAFETYLMSLGEEYELALMGDTQAVIFNREEGVEVSFLLNGQLVSMVFTPAEEGGIADSALSIAETFYIYTPEEGEAEESTAATEASE